MTRYKTDPYPFLSDRRFTEGYANGFLASTNIHKGNITEQEREDYIAVLLLIFESLEIDRHISEAVLRPNLKEEVERSLQHYHQNNSTNG